MIIERDIYPRVKPYLKRKEALIITGMRRVGKTTFVTSIFEAMPSSNKLFLDLENIINQKIFQEDDYEAIKRSLEQLGVDFSKPSFIFLDEIQFARNIASVAKYLIDHYGVKFFMTGSASFYLKNLFSESLSGRKFIFELFPFSFKEFLRLKQETIAPPAIQEPVSRAIYGKLNPLYEEYLEFGGFPEVIVAKTKAEKHKILEDIVSSYIQLEVAHLSEFRKIDALKDLILLLAEQTGQKVDVKKTSAILGIARQTVMDYLSFFESTYLITLVKPFSKSASVEIRKTPKVYFCDSGLVNRLGKVSRGSLLEQSVFQALHPKGELRYYQRKSGVEVDFISDKKTAYEVKITPEQKDLKRLAAITYDLQLKKYYLVAQSYAPLLHCVYGFQL